MAFRPRLIPAVIIAASALLGLKAADFVLDGGADSIAAAWAQAAAPTANAPPVALTPAPTPAPTSAPVPAAPAAAPPAVSSEAAAKAAPSAAPKPLAVQAKEGQDPLLMSPAEVEILQKLSNRRTELDKRAAELRQREVVMQAAEKRIDEKIAKLEALQKSIDTTAQKQSEEDDARIKSLVGIYERMKPRDAARIFEQLDMPVLISVLEHMRDMKAAPILASMDPVKAKAVTLALAERHDSQSGGNSVAQAQSIAR